MREKRPRVDDEPSRNNSIIEIQINSKNSEDYKMGQTKDNFNVPSVEGGNSQISNLEKNNGGKCDFKYDVDHRGPYIVYVDKVDQNGKISSINSVALSRIIKDLGFAGVLDVNKIGFGRAKVVCRNAAAANILAGNKKLMESGYQGKIFGHFVSKMGIIFGVPVDITEDELTKAIQSDVDILKVIRVTKMEQGVRVNTPRVKILFKGLDLPKTIRLYEFTKRDVKHFISFGTCLKCYRHNHYAQHCKQKISSCRKCYHRHEENAPCILPIVCPNCEGNHSPIVKDCPARERAYQIKRIMTMENVSQGEARIKYAKHFSNRYSLLDEELEDNFPALSKSSNKSKGEKTETINSYVESAKLIHAKQPYAKVAKVNINRQREQENAAKTMLEYKKALEVDNVYKSGNGTALVNPNKVEELGNFLTGISADLGTINRNNTGKITNEHMRFLIQLKQKIDRQLADIDTFIMRSKVQEMESSQEYVTN